MKEIFLYGLRFPDLFTVKKILSYPERILILSHPDSSGVQVASLVVVLILYLLLLVNSVTSHAEVSFILLFHSNAGAGNSGGKTALLNGYFTDISLDLSLLLR